MPKVQFRNFQQPKWFNSDIRHQPKVRRTLQRSLNCHSSNFKKDKLTKLENNLQMDMVSAKTNYETSLIHLSTSESKSKSAIYKYIRSLCKVDTLPLSMHLDDKDASFDEQKARLFKEFFHSIYSPPSPLPTTDQLSFSNDNTPCISSIEEDVFKALISLNSDRAKGIDNFGSLFLKQCSLALTTPLHHMFNTSIRSGIIPSQWRTHFNLI